MLSNNAMGFLPYIISGKVNKIISRKSLNKKEVIEMESSQYYNLVVEKYKNPKILQQILGTIATIITSSFSVIDYHDRELNGTPIIVETKIVIEEFLMYILLI
jgi:predicted membrane-bound spermidine synthase